MRPADKTRQFIKNASINSNPEVNEAVLKDLLNELDKSENIPLDAPQPNIWRDIMKSRITKLAATAVIFVAVIAGWPLLDKKHSVAVADVLARVEQIRAFMYKMNKTITGSMMPGMPARIQEIEGTYTVSPKYGMKCQMDMNISEPNTGETSAITQQIYFLPEQKVMFTIMPEQKKFVRMDLDDDLLDRIKKQNNDPREMMRQMVDCGHKELGRSEINGIEVEGFETSDPKFFAGITEQISTKLWVDVETKLPVLMEMDKKMNEMSTHGVISDFQWDVPVTASDFEPVIPDDYTPIMEGGYKMPSMTEEAAIEGLKFFDEIFGKYPKKIDMMNLMKEFSSLEKDGNLTEAGLKLMEEMKQMKTDQDPTNAVVAKTMEIMRPVQSLAMFYMTLAQDDKEPMYYGDTVVPADIDAVLMRWKISDNEYRIIFGDLSVGNATPEELSNLEQQ